MENLDVIVVGELNVDLILTGIPSLPEMGKEKIVKDMYFTMGSASAIFASNIAKLGMNVGFIGKIGKDDFGQFMLKSLKEKNVDTSSIIKDNTLKTGITVSLSFLHDYAMVTYPGAMDYLTIDDINFDHINRAKHMFLSNYFLQPGMYEGCSKLFKHTKEIGLTTSFDPGWDPAEKWDKAILEVLEYVDIFLPNEQEALNITGSSNIDSALDTLSEIVDIVVIKLGNRGALAKKGNKVVKSNVFKINVIDTTGAGDSFNSGYLYKYLKGASVEECLIFGSACGAIATTKLGGTTASPTLKEVENFLKERQKETKGIVSS